MLRLSGSWLYLNLEKTSNLLIFWVTFDFFNCLRWALWLAELIIINVTYQSNLPQIIKAEDFTTGGPHYLRTIYLQIHLFTFHSKLVQNFNVSTANNKGKLYFKMKLDEYFELHLLEVS